MIQIIKYKCCSKIFAACSEPDCYTDKNWLKDLKKYVNRGDKVEMIPGGNGLILEKCECIMKKIDKAIELKNKNEFLMRSCWECNHSHEYLKEVDGLFFCFDCGRWYMNGEYF